MLQFNQKIIYLLLISSFLSKIECSASATTQQIDNNELQITLPNQKTYKIDRLLSEKLHQATPEQKQELLHGMIQYTQQYDRRKIHLKSLQDFMKSGTTRPTTSSTITFNPSMQTYHPVLNADEDYSRIPDTVDQEFLPASHHLDQSKFLHPKLGGNRPITDTYRNKQETARQRSAETSWYNYFNERDEHGELWYPDTLRRALKAMPNGDQIWLDNQGNIIQIPHHHFDLQGKMKQSGQEFIAQTQQLGTVIESFPNGTKIFLDRFGQRLQLTPEMIEENGLLKEAGRNFVLEENDFVREKKLAEQKRLIAEQKRLTQKIQQQEPIERQNHEEEEQIQYEALKRQEAEAKKRQEVERRRRQEIENQNRIKAAAQEAAARKEALRQEEANYRARQAEALLQQAADIEQYEYEMAPRSNLAIDEQAGPPASSNGEDYQDM